MGGNYGFFRVAGTRNSNGVGLSSSHASMDPGGRRDWRPTICTGVDTLGTLSLKHKGDHHIMISVTLQGASWDEPVTEGATAPAKGKRGRKKTIEVQGVGEVVTTFPATEVRAPEKSDPTQAAAGAAISQVAPPTTAAAPLALGEVKKKLQGYLTKFGLPKAAALVQAKTGVPKLVDAPESTWPALVAAIDAEMGGAV